MVVFNIIATVGTTEVDLAPYPGGSPTVPKGKYRNIYALILSNQSATANTITIRIYKGTALEVSIPISIMGSSTISVVSENKPVFIVPSERTLRAIASADSVSVLMVGKDE